MHKERIKPRRASGINLLCRLAIIAALCLAAVTLPAAPAGADNDEPRIDTSPYFVVPGDSVRVDGKNFQPDDEVDIFFAGVPQTYALVADNGTFSATFNVPESPGGVRLIEAEVERAVLASANVHVWPRLLLGPTEGPVGTTVSIVGQGYGQNEKITDLYFGGRSVLTDDDLRADALGSWAWSFEVPIATSGLHPVDTQPAALRPATFTVVPGISLDRSWGSPGESILMTGGGFRGDERGIVILFDGETITPEPFAADNRGYWQEPFRVPEMPAGQYTVTAEGDFTSKEDAGELTFEIRPGIFLSPDEGHVGMNVTAHGRGFAPDEEVTVFYEDDEVGTATADDEGSFEFTFPLPESRHGARQVTAEDGAGNTTEEPAVFTMESDPPDTPELISPTDGDRVGFASKVRPAFRWEEVFDVSGVYYSLQISTSANVTADGDFVDPVFSKERLTGNYTLERDEALPHDTYYWIVRAVDGAENKSEWSDPQSFRAGRLPLWAFVVIIVFVVLGAGGAGHYFLVRRRMYD